MFLYPIQSIRFDAKYDLSCCSYNPGKSITPCWLQSSPLVEVVLFWTFVAVLEFRPLLALVDRLLFFPNNPPFSPSSNLVIWHLWQNAKLHPWVGLNAFLQQKMWILFLSHTIFFPVAVATLRLSSLLFFMSIDEVYLDATIRYTSMMLVKVIIIHAK